MARLTGCLALVVLLSVGALGCGCMGWFDPCEDLFAKDPSPELLTVVFVGSVVVGTSGPDQYQPAQLRVEEVFRGLSPLKKLVEVDPASGTSCFFSLKPGEKWLIIGRRRTDADDIVYTNVCDASTQIGGNERWLDVMRRARLDGRPGLTGMLNIPLFELSGRDSLSGIQLKATSGKLTLTATADADGYFEFADVSPGTWKISPVSDELATPDEKLLNEIPIPERGCAYRDVWAIPNGRIEGTVRDASGAPIAGVPVGVFFENEDGSVSERGDQSAVTRDDGQFLLEGIRPGKLVVGVNGSTHVDQSPWPAQFFPNATERDGGQRLDMPWAGTLQNIDFVLGKPRTPARLLVDTVFADGQPATKAKLRLTDALGRELAPTETGGEGNAAGGSRELMVYHGEVYTVTASVCEVRSAMKGATGGEFQCLDGKAENVQIEDKVTQLTLVLK